MRSLFAMLIRFIWLALLTLVILPAWAMKPLREYPARPADFGIICQEVDFCSADGLTLRGWLYPPQDTVGLMNNLIGRVPAVPESLRPKPREYVFSGQPAPAIIICDGDAGNMSSSIF